MDDGVVAHVDSYVTAVADNITWLCIGKADTITCASKSTRTMWKANTEVCIDTHNEPRAISSVGQACPAVYIRIANEL